MGCARLVSDKEPESRAFGFRPFFLGSFIQHWGGAGVGLGPHYRLLHGDRTSVRHRRCFKMRSHTATARFVDFRKEVTHHGAKLVAVVKWLTVAVPA